MFDLDKQHNLIRSLTRQFSTIAAVLIVALVVAQFGILAVLGTRGTQIEQIRAEKDALRVENEYLLSQIDEARTGEKLTASISNLGLRPARVVTLEPLDSGQLASAD